MQLYLRNSTPFEALRRGLCFLFIVFLIGLGENFYSQTQEKSESAAVDASKSVFNGDTEAMLINGRPALRVLSRKNMPAEIYFENRDNTDAFAVPILHPHKLSACVGKLYVSRDRITFVPDTDKEDYLNVVRKEIEKIEAGEKYRGGRALRFKARGDGKTFILIGDAGRQVINFLGVAINDFDAALKEFEKLTASVRPESEEDEEEQEETTPEITEKHDRFKDITFVRTSRMLLRGGRRSIRTSAEYSFPGSVFTRPTNILLYFYASAARPVFREDDLELNFLVDGSRITAGRLRLSDEEKTKTVVRQTIVVTLPLATFERIANSKETELQIGTLEYKVTDSHLSAFRQLLAPLNSR